MRLLGTLRGRLFALLAVLGAVGGATCIGARAEADPLFDHQLRQMALSLRDQGRVDGEEAAVLNAPRFDYVVQIWSLQGLELFSSLPQGLTEALPARAVLAYCQLRLGEQDWRVFSAAAPLRVVQVAQPLAVLADGRSGNTADRPHAGDLARTMRPNQCVTGSGSERN